MSEPPRIECDSRYDEAAHLQRVAERQAHLQRPEVRAAITARAYAVVSRIDQRARERALQGAMKAKSRQAQVQWLRVEVATITDAVRGEAACRDGCAHCCSIAVTVSRAEVETIGREIGRKPVEPPPDILENAARLQADNDAGARDSAARRMRDRWTGVACTFLRNDRCSIYAHRPIACRQHYSMDVDDLLCRLRRDGKAVDGVPYLNVSPSQQLYATALAMSDFADLRDWFPPR